MFGTIKFAFSAPDKPDLIHVFQRNAKARQEVTMPQVEEHAGTPYIGPDEKILKDRIQGKEGIIEEIEKMDVSDPESWVVTIVDGCMTIMFEESVLPEVAFNVAKTLIHLIALANEADDQMLLAQTRAALAAALEEQSQLEVRIC